MTNDASNNARRVIERYCKAWVGDDLDGILGSYSDGFTLHYFGDNPFTGDHVGKDAAVATLLATGAKAPRKVVAIDETFAGETGGAIVVRELIANGGEELEIRRVLRFRVEGDHLAECWLYEENQPFIDQAWS